MVQPPAEAGIAQLVRKYGSTSSRSWESRVSKGSSFTFQHKLV